MPVVLALGAAVLGGVVAAKVASSPSKESSQSRSAAQNHPANPTSYVVTPVRNARAVEASEAVRNFVV